MPLWEPLTAREETPPPTASPWEPTPDEAQALGGHWPGVDPKPDPREVMYGAMRDAIAASSAGPPPPPPATSAYGTRLHELAEAVAPVPPEPVPDSPEPVPDPSELTPPTPSSAMLCGSSEPTRDDARAVNEFADSLKPRVTCDVCSAAKLAESGVMPSSVSPDELHSRCREPGTCTCGCEQSLRRPCRNCRRPIAPADLDASGECVDRPGCARAMLESRPAPAAPAKSPRATSAPRGPRTTAPRAPAAARPTRDPRTPRKTSIARPCTCGCEGTTKGGLYLPGHDSKHLTRITADIRAGKLPRAEGEAMLPSDKLREKLAVRLV